MDLIDAVPCQLAYVSKVAEPSQPLDIDRCAICLDQLILSEGDIVMIQCTHSFHSECLSKCLEITCPGSSSSSSLSARCLLPLFV